MGPLVLRPLQQIVHLLRHVYVLIEAIAGAFAHDFVIASDRIEHGLIPYISAIALAVAAVDYDATIRFPADTIDKRLLPLRVLSENAFEDDAVEHHKTIVSGKHPVRIFAEQCALAGNNRQ